MGPSEYLKTAKSDRNFRKDGSDVFSCYISLKRFPFSWRRGNLMSSTYKFQMGRYQTEFSCSLILNIASDLGSTPSRSPEFENNGILDLNLKNSQVWKKSFLSLYFEPRIRCRLQPNPAPKFEKKGLGIRKFNQVSRQRCFGPLILNFASNFGSDPIRVSEIQILR